MTKKRRSGGRNKPAGARGHVSEPGSRHISACNLHLTKHSLCLCGASSWPAHGKL